MPTEYRPHEHRPANARDVTRDETFYNRKAWRVARAIQLKAEPMCRSCDAPAVCVDHITRISIGGDPFLRSNLQSLCHTCHSKKTMAERLGREWKSVASQDSLRMKLASMETCTIDSKVAC